MKTICSQNSGALGNATRRLACLGLAVAMLAGWTVSAATLHVWPDSPNPMPPYDSWGNAATNIQDAEDTAEPGDLVLVTNGVYATGGRAVVGTMTNRVVIDKAITVQSVNGPKVTVIEGAPGIRCAYVGTNAILSGFTLTHGDADKGGGAYCASSGILTNCVVTGNSAGYGGGVVGGTLYNCALTGNSAKGGGGADYSTLYNCTLTGNSATNSGGGASGGTLYNCTLTGNTATSGGGGCYYSTLYNCIVYFNSAPSNSDYSGGIFNYSCTTPLPTNGVGNISVDPQMVTLMHLSATSPCIAAGSSAYATGVDIDGEVWADPPCMGADQWTSGQATGLLTLSIEAEYTNVVPGIVVQFVGLIQGDTLASVWDFGDGTFLTNQPVASHAWSAPGSYTVRLTGYNDSFPEGVTATVQVEVPEGVYYVNRANPSPLFPYTSWATAATNIQDAIEAGTTIGRLVLVTNGVYASGSVILPTENSVSNRIALPGRVQVRSVNGPEVTVIEGAPGIRCAYVGTNAMLSGFTLTKGDIPRDSSESFGGGAFCEESAILTNCIITDNSASAGGGAWRGTLYNCILNSNSADNGGGIFLGTSGTLYNCTLTGNSAAFLGGGASSGTLYNCTLTGNSAAGEGGGGVDGGTLYNCILTGNSASSAYGSGGGAYYGTLYNCILSGNSAYVGGGAAMGTLYNCTLTGNSAVESGGATAVLYNCIVYFNSAQFGPNYSASSLYNSCTTPLPDNGVGNISADPRFVDAANGDFRLLPGSPCIDAGTNLSDILTTDFDGNPRPLDGNYDGVAQFDMGAYEFNPYGTAPRPEQIGAYNTSGFASDVAVVGNFAYVADGQAGLQVIDTSNSYSPVRVGGFSTSGYAVGVAVSSNYAYLADGFAGLQVIDISNPANPYRVGSYDTSGYATDVAVMANYAIVADGQAGLQIIDINNPSNPQRVGGYQTSGSANGVVVSGNYAYVAYSRSAGDGGLEVVDIGNPAAPAQVGAIDSLGVAHNVALAGNDAYVATSHGLEVVDVSEPAAPVRVGSYDTVGEISDVAVADIYAYVVDRAIGLHVLDISDPTDPKRVAANASFSASGVTAAGDKVYVAAGEDGLIILNQIPWLRFPGFVASDGLIRLSLKGAGGQCVCVQRSTDLVHWEDWKTVTLGENGCELIDDTSAAPQMFYRVVKDNSITTNQP